MDSSVDKVWSFVSAPHVFLIPLPMLSRETFLGFPFCTLTRP
jgi:hypothetical protein